MWFELFFSSKLKNVKKNNPPSDYKLLQVYANIVKYTFGLLDAVYLKEITT